ncbi:MAG: DUF3619 family protein [Sulfuritalea sp.]|jgi:hypothetical protein|nr:DUF3619 family protein [Sulfuritalea sp.]
MRKNKSINNIDNDHLKAESAADEQLAYLASNLLDDHAQHLNATTLQRLSEARALAVSQLTASQAELAGINQSGSVLQWFSNGFNRNFEQHRMMFSLIIVLAMALTFFVVKQYGVDKNIEHSDAFLLAAELPPEAFADKGFDTWLVSKQD